MRVSASLSFGADVNLKNSANGTLSNSETAELRETLNMRPLKLRVFCY